MDAASIVAVLAGVGAMLGGFYKVISEVNDREKKDLKRSNEYVNGRVDELRQDISEMRLEIKHLQSERGELIATVSDQAKKIDMLEEKLDVVKRERDSMKREVTKLRARLDAYEEK